EGAHARRCAGSVSACQTFSREWRSSLTRVCVHFSPSFRTCAPLAGPGVYCSRSVIILLLTSAWIIRSPSALPALQLRHLNEIAAGVLEHGALGGRHVFWWHGELGAAPLHTFVIGLHVVGEEHGRGLALLEHGLLVSFGSRLVVERQLQLRAVRVLWRGHREPTIRPLAEVGLLHEAQHFGIEAQSLLLVIDVHAGQFDPHFVL